jgi:PHD/YefM family antitoxin component YafN of YafNO toxin-antitoxin module
MPLPSEKRLEIADLPDAAKEMIAECELSGRRTVYQRNSRPVAILISFDEYLALRETIDIARDAPLIERIAIADAETQRNAILLPEDLFGE